MQLSAGRVQIINYNIIKVKPPLKDEGIFLSTVENSRLVSCVSAWRRNIQASYAAQNSVYIVLLIHRKISNLFSLIDIISPRVGKLLPQPLLQITGEIDQGQQMNRTVLRRRSNINSTGGYATEYASQISIDYHIYIYIFIFIQIVFAHAHC